VIKKDVVDQVELEQQQNEIQILKMAQHPNICQMIDTFETRENIYIIIEFFKGGDLFDYLKKRTFNVGEDRIREIFYRVSLAIGYLHSIGIVHRDIKLENIMMSEDTDNSQPKLIDFGLAKVMGPEDKCTDTFGTFGYCAPEVILGKSYSFGVDVWSMGCLLYVMLSEYLPFDSSNQEEVAENTCLKEVSFDVPEFEKCHHEVQTLIRLCLEKSRRKRIESDDILKHPWISRHFTYETHVNLRPVNA